MIDALVKDGHLATHQVTPLDAAAIVALLDVVLDGPIDPAAATQLAERSQGNLQILQELVWRAMDEGLLRVEDAVWQLDSLPRSGSLEELVASHIDGIDIDVREALDLLAVAGTLDLTDLEQIVDRRVLEELETREVIRVTTDDRRTTVGLTHPVYGEVIRSQMPVLRTRAIQRRLADQLDRRGAERREDVTRLALWRLEAGGDVDVDVLLRAGRLALVGRDAELAARFASAAADHGAAVPAAPIAVEAATLAADADGLEQAVAEVWNDPTLPDHDRVHLARRLSTSRFAGGDLPGALEAVSDAEELLTDSTSRAGVQAQRAHLLASNGRPREALDVLAAIDTEAADVTDGRLRIEVAAARARHA